MAYTQGKYNPQNRNKYIGVRDPEYRSSWERSAFIKLDSNPNVLRWGSEIVVLPYVFELDGKKHKYYIDLYVEMRTGDTLVKWLIEIKPDDKLMPPKKPKINSARALRGYNLRMADYYKNMDKWKFASRYATMYAMDFLIMTEKGVYSVNGDTLTKISNKRHF